jgi:hypothetical protein
MKARTPISDEHRCGSVEGTRGDPGSNRQVGADAAAGAKVEAREPDLLRAYLALRPDDLATAWAFVDVEPLLVTASLSWRWSALQTARTNTTEEDVVTGMFGRLEGAGGLTENPLDPSQGRPGKILTER